jgi:hypothetical protein
MNILEINIYFGVSVIMKYNAIFTTLLHEKKVDEIHVSLAIDVIKKYRDTYSDTYTQNFYSIMKYIFEDPRIKICQSDIYPTLDINQVLKIYNTTLTYRILPQVTRLPPVFTFEYITISTKILNVLSKHEYQLIKPLFYKILSEIKIPIILLGERTVKSCHEYRIHNTYSIYNDLKQFLPNSIDKTIESSEGSTELEPLLESLSILNKSKLNIFMSCGGVSVITFFTSESFLGLTNDYYSADMFQYKNSNFCINSNINKFLEFLYGQVLNINKSIIK